MVREIFNLNWNTLPETLEFRDAVSLVDLEPILVDQEKACDFLPQHRLVRKTVQ